MSALARWQQLRFLQPSWLGTARLFDTTAVAVFLKSSDLRL
jgi:hypothetical protein